MNKPALSVIMTNYNYERYIGNALQAIARQSYRPQEVIIVDDASTDNSVNIIERLLAQLPNASLIRNSQNKGALYSINKAFGIATGDYIYSAASDDKILEGFFTRSMELLTEHPQAGLCCSDPVYYEEDKNSCFIDNLGLDNKPAYIGPEALVEKIKTKGLMIAGHTVIIKRDSLKKAGGYDPELKWHCDWFAHLVIAFRNGICYLPEPLAQLRLSKTSYSGRNRAQNGRQEIRHMLDLLKSEQYSDVLPYFKRSQALARLGWDLVVLTILEPKYRDLFCLKAFWYAFKQSVKPLTPFIIKNLFRRTRNYIRISS